MPKATATKKAVSAPAPYQGPGAKKAAAPAAGAKKAAGKGKKPADKYAAIYGESKVVAGVGQALPSKRDVSAMVKWPKYIRQQHQKKVLQVRLRVPPAINQFSKVLDAQTCELLIFVKYRQETQCEETETVSSSV